MQYAYRARRSTVMSSRSFACCSTSRGLASSPMRALTLVVTLSLASPAAAAEIKLWPNWNNQGRDIVVVDGVIAYEDQDKFREIVGNIQNRGEAIVDLRSQGGNAVAGLDMADVVRRAGMKTHVPDGRTCASACALIWVAGSERFAGKNSCIGFHGLFDPTTGQQSASLSAVAGAELGYIGLSLDAVYWMLSARELDTHWLTTEIANKLGIMWTKTPDDQVSTCGLIAQKPPQLPPPVSLKMRTLYNLNLREAPDPRSENLLAYWAPEDFIPIGTVFEWRTNTPDCTTAPDGSNWCKVTHQHNGTKTTGWVAIRYMETIQ